MNDETILEGEDGGYDDDDEDWKLRWEEAEAKLFLAKSEAVILREQVKDLELGKQYYKEEHEKIFNQLMAEKKVVDELKAQMAKKIPAVVPKPSALPKRK